MIQQPVSSSRCSYSSTLWLVEADRLGDAVVGADDRGVAARVAGADVVGLDDGDVGDAVARGEVVGGGQAVAAAADDHDVVARLRLVPASARAASRRTRSPEALRPARRRGWPTRSAARDRRPITDLRRARRRPGPGRAPAGRRQRPFDVRGATRVELAGGQPRAGRSRVLGFDDRVRIVDGHALRVPSDDGVVGGDAQHRHVAVGAATPRRARPAWPRRRGGRCSGSGASTGALRVVERGRRDDRLAAVDRRRCRRTACASASRASRCWPRQRRVEARRDVADDLRRRPRSGRPRPGPGRPW